MVTVVELPIVPDSFNKTRFAPWYVSRAANQQLKETLGWSLLASDLPRGLEEVTVGAALRFPTRRRRDEGNFRTPLEKALGDALVEGGYLADDTPDHFRFDRVVFLQEPGPAQTLLTFKWSRRRTTP